MSHVQARAHSLLKSKDLELKGAKETAESAVASALSDAQRLAQDTQDELQKVIFLSPCYPLEACSAS